MNFIKALIIFLPPATGNIQNLLSEFEEYKKRGYAVQVIRPKAPTHKKLEDPQAEVNYWRELRKQVCHQAKTKEFILMGKNLGGSQAAFIAQECRPKASIVFGSIPSLTDFYLHSNHPVAKAEREAQEIHPQYKEIASPLDLTVNLQPSIPSLIQFGSDDPWLEGASLPQSRENVRVKWFTDDHEMVAEPTRKARIDFLEQWVK